MSGKAIKREFLPRFRGLPRHSGAKAGLILASYLLQIALAMKLGAQLAGSGTGTGIAAAAVAAAFIATRLRGLNNIVHECSHATFARDPASNEAFGKIAAALIRGISEGTPDASQSSRRPRKRPGLQGNTGLPVRDAADREDTDTAHRDSCLRAAPSGLRKAGPLCTRRRSCRSREGGSPFRGMLLGSCGSGASGHPLLPAVVLDVSGDQLLDRLRRPCRTLERR